MTQPISKYDEVISNILGAVPDPERSLRIAPVAATTWETIGPGLTSFTLWLDFGSGTPVRASTERVTLDYAQSLNDTFPIVGRRAIVGFISGSPVVLGLLGYNAIQV